MWWWVTKTNLLQQKRHPLLLRAPNHSNYDNHVFKGKPWYDHALSQPRPYPRHMLKNPQETQRLETKRATIGARKSQEPPKILMRYSDTCIYLDENIGFYEYIKKYWWIFWHKISMRWKLIKTCENVEKKNLNKWYKMQ